MDIVNSRQLKHLSIVGIVIEKSAVDVLVFQNKISTDRLFFVRRTQARRDFDTTYEIRISYLLVRRIKR